MMAAMRAVEGFLPFRGHRTWYRSVGEPAPGTLPLLCLHGGPGSSHNYFRAFADALAAEGRRVVLYDQLGCGDSDRPDDDSLWTLELFVAEVRAVRDALGLRRVHLLGTSWGGMLAQEYALTQPDGLESLVLSSTLADADQWASEARRLLAALGPDAGDEELMAAHFCRLDPTPPEMEIWKTKRSPRVYEAMWGPNEYTPTGRLKGWSTRERLGEIRVPTLVIRGAFDMCTPPVAQVLVEGIAGAELVVLEHSAHVPVIEEPERYRAIVVGFLARVEAGLEPSDR
jgi:pimeloyl-ACP methyl ester carboxylesterase